jgi:DNA-binding MarR family transcriptional regulator
VAASGDEPAAALAEAVTALQHAGGAAQPAPGTEAFQRYFHGIAEAHYVIRKVFRIVDTEARSAGLDPLEHKVLVQALGAPGTPLRINDVAARLDIAPALASRLIKRLELRGLLARTRGESDRRTTRVTVTAPGRELLADVDRRVRLHVDYFQAQLSDAERMAAMQIFGFYLGAGPTAP